MWEFCFILLHHWFQKQNTQSLTGCVQVPVWAAWVLQAPCSGSGLSRGDVSRPEFQFSEIKACRFRSLWRPERRSQECSPQSLTWWNFPRIPEPVRGQCAICWMRGHSRPQNMIHTTTWSRRRRPHTPSAIRSSPPSPLFSLSLSLSFSPRAAERRRSKSMRRSWWMWDNFCTDFSRGLARCLYMRWGWRSSGGVCSGCRDAGGKQAALVSLHHPQPPSNGRLSPVPLAGWSRPQTPRLTWGRSSVFSLVFEDESAPALRWSCAHTGSSARPAACTSAARSPLAAQCTKTFTLQMIYFLPR